MHAQCTPAAFRQDFEIAARLRCLDHAESIGMTGHRKVPRVLAGDLKEDAAVRAALVGLTGRVLKARPEADAGRRFGGSRIIWRSSCNPARYGRGSLDIGEQRGVITGAEALEMALRPACEAGRLRPSAPLRCGVGEKP